MRQTLSQADHATAAAPRRRIPFASVQRLEPLDGQAFVVASTQVGRLHHSC